MPRGATTELQALLDASPDPVLVTDRAGSIVALNRRLEELFGLPAERLLGRPVEVLLPERLRQRHAAARAAYGAAPTVRAMSARSGLTGLRADGTEIPVEVSLTPIVGSDGLVLAMVREAPSLSRALDVIADAVLTTDAGGRVQSLNRAAEALTGWSRGAAVGRPIEEVLPLAGEPDAAPLESPVAACLRTGTAGGGCEALLPARGEGESRLLDISAAPVRDEAGAVTGAVVVVRDVTRARRIARQLSHQATHDPLTGLVNRGEFERRLARALAGAAEEKTEHALCFLDLDGFKRVNDACGHLAGDELLRQLADLMRERMRSGDTLGRLGGDEFGLLLEHCPPPEASRIAEGIRRAISAHRFLCGGRTHAVGASIGVVPVRSGGHPTDLLRAADAACYRAKRSGGNRVELTEAHRRAGPAAPGVDWVHRVLAAIEEDRFLLYAQPIRPLDGSATPAPALELLLRLADEPGEPLLPGAFLPAARRYGLLPGVDRWVIRHAVRRLSEWRRSHPGEEPPGVAINLGDESVVEGEVVTEVGKALGRSGLPPQSLCFEIGESAAVAYPSASTRLVRELREMGCRATLEHGGSSMAAFTVLRRLQVDYLKIAGHVVRGLARDPVSHALAGALNDVGHALGLGTIAIEAESPELLDRLRRLGVDYAQGYGVGRPEPLDSALSRGPRPAPSSG